MVVMKNGEEYLTAEEARSLLGVKAATLYAYVSRGLLASYRQGMKRQRLYKKSQIEGLLELQPGSKLEEALPDSTSETNSADSGIPAADSWIPYV